MPVSAAKRKRPNSSLDDFDVAFTWFLAALMLSDKERIEVTDRAARQAPGVAVYTQALVVRQAWDAVDAARRDGVSLEEAKARLTEALEREWVGGEKSPAWRIDLLAGMATQKSYQAGRHSDMTAPGRREPETMWQFTSALEARTCSFCRSLHGTTLPAGHVWWLTHMPLLHPQCLCSVLVAEPGATATENPPDLEPDDGFGGPPDEFEVDWDAFAAPIGAVGRAKR